MKIKLAVSKEHYDEIKTMLPEHGIEIDDNADLVLSESNRFLDSLTVKNKGTNGRIISAHTLPERLWRSTMASLSARAPSPQRDGAITTTS